MDTLKTRIIIVGANGQRMFKPVEPSNVKPEAMLAAANFGKRTFEKLGANGPSYRFRMSVDDKGNVKFEEIGSFRHADPILFTDAFTAIAHEWRGVVDKAAGYGIKADLKYEIIYPSGSLAYFRARISQGYTEDAPHYSIIDLKGTCGNEAVVLAVLDAVTPHEIGKGLLVGPGPRDNIYIYTRGKISEEFLSAR